MQVFVMIVLDSLLAFLAFLSLIVAACYSAFKKNSRKRRVRPKEEEHSLPKPFQESIDVMFQGMWLCKLWIILAIFMQQRAEIEDIDGNENPLSDWSFGQILALSTWVPVFVEFFCTYFCEFHFPPWDSQPTHA